MKKIIKTNSIKAVAMLIVIILAMASLSVSAFAVTAPTPANGNVVVNGATPGDTFSAYKVISVTYNESSNTLSFDWTEEVNDAINSTAPTVAEFAALGKDDRQEFLAGIAAALVEKVPAKSGVVADDSGLVTFEELPWGEYLIVPTLTTSVYEIMLGAVQPVVINGEWSVTQGEQLGVKKSDGPVVSNTANDDNVGLWSTITYTIEFSVPKYDGTCVDKKFSITDTATSGLTYKENMTVYGVNADGSTELTLSDVTLADSTTVPALNASGFTFTLDFNYDTISTYDKIKVTYNAQINDNAVLKTEGDDAPVNSNEAELKYSNYPYVANSHETTTSTEEVFTYGIKIFKYDGNSTSNTTPAEILADTDTNPLADAKFDIYRPVESGETGVEVSGITGNVVKVNADSEPITPSLRAMHQSNI